MDIEYVREFLALATDLNYSTVAKKLHMSRPTLVNHIHELELNLDCRLISHGDRVPELTVAGKRFIFSAQDLLGQWDTLRSEYAAFADNFSQISVAPVTLTFIDQDLYRARHEIQTLYPHKHYDISINNDPINVPVCMDATSLNDTILVTGQKRFANPSPAIIPEEYHGFYAGTYALLMFATWSSPLFSKPEICMEDLDGQTVVLGTDIGTTWLRDEVQEYFAQKGAHLNVEINTYTNLSEYYSQDFNGALGVVPEPLIPRYGLDGNKRFRIFSPSGITLDTDYYVCFRDDFLKTENGQLLFDEMKSLAPDNPDSA